MPLPLESGSVEPFVFFFCCFEAWRMAMFNLYSLDCQCLMTLLSAVGVGAAGPVLPSDGLDHEVQDLSIGTH